MLNDVFLVDIIQSDGNAVTIQDAVAVRIVSRYYNLLIMKDYMPIVGEIDGSVAIIGKTSQYAMKSGLAYFINCNNKFTLIIKEDRGGKSGFVSGTVLGAKA